MTRTCGVCQKAKDISDIYVGRHYVIWPKVLCKKCQPNMPIPHYPKRVRINGGYKPICKSALEILLGAGYPTHMAINIINRGL